MGDLDWKIGFGVGRGQVIRIIFRGFLSAQNKNKHEAVRASNMVKLIGSSPDSKHKREMSCCDGMI